MRVEILNWERFNSRKDVKAPSWFRLSHSLFEDHEFYDFTHTEIVVWIYLLCLASRTSSSTVLVNLQHAERVGRIKPKDFYAAIQKLERNQCVIMDDPLLSRARYGGVTPAAATLHNKTLHNKTLLPDSPLRDEPRRAFDFELLYQKYPRKEGKQKGVVACKAQIRSQEDYDSLSRAVDRYAEHTKKNVTDPKYIKHFSTFMASWRDWLDPATGSATVAPSGEINWDNVFKEKKDAS